MEHHRFEDYAFEDLFAAQLSVVHLIPRYSRHDTSADEFFGPYSKDEAMAISKMIREQRMVDFQVDNSEIEDDAVEKHLKIRPISALDNRKQIQIAKFVQNNNDDIKKYHMIILPDKLFGPFLEIRDAFECVAQNKDMFPESKCAILKIKELKRIKIKASEDIIRPIVTLHAKKTIEKKK